jgi:hypothetical protein
MQQREILKSHTNPVPLYNRPISTQLTNLPLCFSTSEIEKALYFIARDETLQRIPPPLHPSSLLILLFLKELVGGGGE